MNEGEGLDTNNSSYHYVGLIADIKSGSSKSFSIQTEEEKIAEIALF